VLHFARNPDAGSDATRMQTNDYHITIIFPHSRHLHPGVGIIIELVQSGQIFLLDSYLFLYFYPSLLNNPSF
jgi:hypothetical protein